MMRKMALLINILVVGALLFNTGCDRQDNDWQLFDPSQKLVAIGADTLTVQEGGAFASFDVSLGMVPSDTVNVVILPANEQVYATPNRLIFAPVDDQWQAVQTVTITAINDDYSEGLHGDALTVMANSADLAYDSQGAVNLIQVIVNDNETAGVQVSETDLTLVESVDGIIGETYRVVLTSRPRGVVEITPRTIPPELSLHIEPAAVTFTPENWHLEQELRLWIELDEIDYNNAAVTLLHRSESTDSNYSPSLDIPSIELTILDDTLPPVATLTFNSGSTNILRESDVATTVDVDVTISKPSAVDVRVHLATENGTASVGEDFINIEQDLLFAPGGVLTQTISITVVDDLVLEAPQEFEVVLTAVENITIGANDRLDVYIEDDDQMALSLSVVSVNEDAGSAEFVVALPQAVTEPISFIFITTAGTATAGQDYESVNDLFIVEAGQPQKIIPVVLFADAANEPDETFSARLEQLSGNVTWSEAPVVCTILNDDPQAVVLADIEVTEDAGQAVFTLEFDKPYNEDLVLTVNTLPGDGTGSVGDQDYATSNVDYAAATNQNWTIPAGTVSAQYSVNITNDSLAEALSENFRLQITTADHAGFAGLVALCTIVDNDQPCLSVADISLPETAGNAVFNVQLLNVAMAPVTSEGDVSFLVETMDQTATAPDDYIAVSQVFTIAAGQSNIDIDVTLLDDTHDDDSETFVLVLSDPVNATGNCIADDAFCTLYDDEHPSLNLRSTALRLNEGSAFEFAVVLTTPRQDETIYTLNVLPGTSDGVGVDYSFGESISQVVLPQQTEVIFTVPFIDDQLGGEVDETIRVEISAANVALGTTELVATIVDAPILAITGDAVDEGETVDFVITQTAASTADVSFNLQFASGSAVSGQDFDGSAVGPHTIPAGSVTTTIVVPTTALDGGDYPVETFIVALVNPSNGTNGPFNSAVGSITDLDPSEISLAGPATSVEGLDNVFTVNLNWTSNAPINFDLTFTDGTAVRAGVDYDDSNTGPYTIPPGQSSFNIAVPTTADGAPELSLENYFIEMHTPVNAVLGAPVIATGNILDADQPELTIAALGSVVEGNDLQFNIHLSVQTIVPVAFVLVYDDGSTQGASDYDSSNTGPYTLHPGDTDMLITVPTFNNLAHENQETFIIGIVPGPTNAVLGTEFEANGVIEDDDP